MTKTPKLRPRRPFIPGTALLSAIEPWHLGRRVSRSKCTALTILYNNWNKAELKLTKYHEGNAMRYPVELNGGVFPQVSENLGGHVNGHSSANDGERLQRDNSTDIEIQNDTREDTFPSRSDFNAPRNRTQSRIRKRRRKSQRRRKVIWDVTESIDYTPFNNAVSLRRSGSDRHERHVYGFSGRTLAMLLATLVAAVLIGITGKVMEIGIDQGVRYRNRMLSQLLASNGYKGNAFMVGLSVISVGLSATAVQWLAPGAAGSGVSLVMAFLNGNEIAGLLTPVVFVVKLCGTVLARVACLTLGPEAPMVHLGACLSSIVFHAGQRIVDLRTLKEHRQEAMVSGQVRRDPVFSNASLRQLISAGAAGGMAAAFGAPIGGVLFALEEACSVWSKKTAWRCLLSTAIAVFTMSQLFPTLGGGYILSFSGIYPLSNRQWLYQLPFVILVSAIAGFIGAMFNLLRKGAQRHRVMTRSHFYRVLEAMAVACMTAVVVLTAPKLWGTCLETPPTWKPEHVMQYYCPDGQYNDLATALMISAPVVVKSFLALGSETEPINRVCTIVMPCYYGLPALLAVMIIYFTFMVLSSGLAIPGGFFMPSVMVGGSFGAFVGIMLNPLAPPSWDIQPGVYAVVGAAATLAAVFRSSVSLVVILVEGTRGINFLPGILVAVIISNFIAHWVHPDGVYESELEADGRVFFLRQEPPGCLRNNTAESLMASPVIGLNEIDSVARVLQVLSSTTHNGFPVYPSPDGYLDLSQDPAAYSRLHGFVLRSQLLILLREKAFCDAQGEYLACCIPQDEYESRLDALMHHATHGGGEIINALVETSDEEDEDENTKGLKLPKVMSRAMQIMDELNEEEPFFSLLLGDKAAQIDASSGIDSSHGSNYTSKSMLTEIYVNLRPFMDTGMITVRPNTPAAHVHQMFVSMSLRHLCVTDESSRLVGIITRKDLDRAAGHGWWRSNRIAAPPAPDSRVLESTPSWFASSLQALAIPPRRLLSDIMQRFSPSPATSGFMEQSFNSSERDFSENHHHPSLEHLLHQDE